MVTLLLALEVSKQFSCEAKFELGTLGYHRIDAYMSEEEVEQVKNQYKN